MDFLSFDTIVVGTGAAGFNAANEIKKQGTKSVAIVTEGVNTGTSRNTGSDKQTYYKLSLSGDSPDSVRNMASDLFSGGAVDGDNALCEAALSARCFYNLCALGVPFPHNRYGEYIGYKTDHDPYKRATSAGPLTSKFMTEALEKQASVLGVPVFDKLLAIEIIKCRNRVAGLLCLNTEDGSFVTFRCGSIILATGGPSGIYENSVYPECHTGSTGLAIKAGAKLQNMTEWQYGLASVKPRWNVSGSYMQTLPRFISIDENGEEREFLIDYIKDEYEALSLVFLKGYQWPFDSKKATDGSSLIDLAVYEECVNLGRRVFLDYRKNPFGLKNIEYGRLREEAYIYLKNAECLFGTPVERLKKMNSPAIELYRSKGVDIEKMPLEISLSAQHNNGGIAVDLWWQTSVEGLFAAGECAGTHGIARPGGSALNAGQAGSLRAAQYISATNFTLPDEALFINEAESVILRHKKLLSDVKANENTAENLLLQIRHDMSSFAAAVRFCDKIGTLCETREKEIAEFPKGIRAKDTKGLVATYKYLDALYTQAAVLCAMKNYCETTSLTRGSAIYKNTGSVAEKADLSGMIQEIFLDGGKFEACWRPVRPIPVDEGFFENVWRGYRENKNIY